MASENEKHYCICISNETQELNDKAALLNGARWSSGDVITVMFLEGDESLRERVKQTAERWTAPGMANLQLRFVESGPADVRIAFEQGDGSWSYLGTQCRGIDQGQHTMNYGWLTPDSDDDELRRVVTHEFGHALGLIHEHQNPEGGIEWNEPAVIADLSGPPNNWDEATIRHNVLDHYPKEDVTATPVDEDSIMMYPIPKAWTLDGFSADLNSDVSTQDVEFIGQAYP
jgi:serralysin